MSYDATGRVIVLTGAAGGIGSTLARALADRGASLVLVDLDHARVDALRDDLGGGHLSYACDLTQRGQVEQLLTYIDQHHGRIDVLINNAGMTSTARFDTRSVESIEQELQVNLIAPLILSRLAIDLLRRSDDPRLLSTVSLGGIFPLGETPIYTASKFGLRGAMLSIAMDLKAKGIKVGSILPSATDTPMLQDEAIEGGNSLQFLDPPQSPEDVARTYLRMLDSPRMERYPRLSESWLVRVVMLAPDLIPKLLPLFRGRGDRGMRRYLENLQARGIAMPTPSGWRRVQ